MFDMSSVVNSMIGSLIIGLLFLGTSPFWWKILRKLCTYKKIRTVVPVVTIVAVIALVMGLSLAFAPAKESYKLVNPSMTEEKISEVALECEMKAMEVTSQMGGLTRRARDERSYTFHRYRNMCLSQNGIELVPVNEKESERE